MFRTWWQKVFSFPRTRLARRRGYRPPMNLLRRTARLSMTALEDRVTPATFVDNGTTLNLVLNTANTNVAVVSTGTSYTLTLTGDTWTGTNDANVTGNGTATLTVTTTGIAAFTNQISFADAAAAGVGVTFNDSGANLYANNFNIQLNNAAAGAITFNGHSSFDTHSLSASTTHNIDENNGAALTTSSGNLTLSANQQASPTSGTFVGIFLQSCIVSSVTGSIQLSGKAGNAGNYGILVSNSTISSIGSALASQTISLVGSGGGFTGGDDFGILVTGSSGLVSSNSGGILLSGTGGAGTGTGNAGVVVFGGARISANGVGTITINGTGGGSGASIQNDGVYLAVVGPPTVTSANGAIEITGTAGVGANSFGINLGPGGGSVTSTGANITLTCDSINLGTTTAVVNAGPNIVTITPRTAGTNVDLGGADAAGTLGLTNAELSRITAGILRIGDTGGVTHDLTVTQPITAPAGWNTLSLFTNTGAIGQNSGASITVANLLVIGAGNITLADPGNTVSKLSAFGVQSVNFVNSTSLTLDSVDPAIEVLANGFPGGASSVGTISITAGGTGSVLTVSKPVNSHFMNLGPGNIILTADDMAINAAVNAGTAAVTLRPVTAGRAVTVGGTAAGTLSLTDAELDNITAGRVSVGDAATGGTLTLAGPITAPAGYNTLELATAAAIVDTIGGAAADITVANLTLTAAAGIGQFAAVKVDATNLNVRNNGPAVSGSVAVIDVAGGVTVTGANLSPAGATNLFATGGGTLTVNATAPTDVRTLAVTGAASATFTLTFNGQTTAALAATATAAQVQAALNALPSVGAAGGTATVSKSGNVFTVIFSGTLAGTAAPLVAAASGGAVVNVGAPADSVTTANGPIFLVADDMTIAGGVNAGTGPVNLNTASASRAISLGTDTAGTLGLTDAELDRVTANLLLVGTSLNTGGIAVTGPITAPAGYNTLGLTTAGAITDATAGEQADIVVGNLALQAGLGIGGADSIDVAGPGGAAINVAFQNTNGAVRISELRTAAPGGMVIRAVAGVVPSFNNGTTTTLAAASPLTFAVNTTSAGTITATTADNNGVNVDNITVNAGVTVESTGGDVVFQAGDDVVLGAGSLVKSDAGAVTLTAASGDADAEGNIAMGTGAVQAGTNITLSARDDITVSTLTANAATGTVTITSTAGNIFDDANDTTLITANALSLSAVRSIGQPGATPDIDTAVNTLTTVTTGSGPFAGAPTAGTWVTDTDDLTVTSATTGDGVILIDAGGSLNAQSATANGTGRNVRLRALGGNLTVGSVTAAGDVVALGAAGAVLDGNAAANNVTALSLLLSAGTGIASAADPLETTVSNLAWSAGTGGVDLVNAGPLTVAAVTAFGATVTGGTGAGAATVTATSPLTVAANVVMGGTVTLTAGEIADFPVCADDLTVNAGVTVQSTAGDVNLRAGDDVILGAGAVISAAGAVRITAGFGDLDNCGTLVDNGATITSGTGISICTVEDLTVGAITAPGQTVTLRSINGAILDGNGAAVNVTAAALGMQANTGIGVGVGGALETAVGNLEALTATGGVFVDNTGALAIGGVTPDATCITTPLTGVRVTGASGDIVLTNTSGNVAITISGDNVVGPNNITIQTLTSGNITTGGSDVVPNGAVRSTGGDVTLNAVQNIFVGDTSGAGSFGDVETAGTGNVRLLAGGNINIDELSFVEARGTGNITVTAGGNISLLHTHLAGAQVDTAGGTITFTTGPNGVFTADASNPPNIFSTFGGAAGGDITVTADNMIINDPINAGAGCVILQQVSTAQAIDLGGPDAAGTLGLTDAELDHITTTAGLRIGRTDAGFTGGITVTAPITQAGSGYTKLNLRANGAVTETGTGALTVTDLVVNGGAVTLDGANNVTNLAGTSAGVFTFNNAGPLTVGAVTVCGVTTNGITPGGPVCLAVTAGNTITVNQAINAGANGVRLSADDLNINAQITGATVQLDPLNAPAGQIIDLGLVGNVAGRFGLSQAELNLVNTPLLQVGIGFNTGGIQVTAPISRPAGTTLSLLTGGSITEGAAGTLTVDNLAARGLGAGGVVLDKNNAIGTIAGSSSAGQPFVVNDTTSLVVGSVNGIFGFGPGAACAGNPAPIDGINFGPVCLTVAAAGGTLTVNQAINAGASSVLLVADDMAINAAVFTGPNQSVTLDTFTAARTVDLGGAGAGARLALTDAELDEIFSPLVQISRTNAGVITLQGDIQITAPISLAPPTTALSLFTNGNVSEPGGPLTVANLTAVGVSVDLSNPANVVGTLAGASTTGPFVFNAVGPLTIGDATFVENFGTGAACAGSITTSAVGVFTTAGGPICICVTGAGNTLTVTDPVSGSGLVLLVADDMAINNTVNGTTAVTLAPFTAARGTSLGTDTAGTLGLTQAELNFVTTPVLQIGLPSQPAAPPAPLAATAGDITVTANVTRPDNTTLSLVTTGAITEGTFALSGATAAGAINLAVQGGSVVLAGANRIGNLAGRGNPFIVNSTTPLTVDGVSVVTGYGAGAACAGTVTALNGITGGPVCLTEGTANGTLTVNQAIDAGANNVLLVADNMVFNADVSGGATTVAPFTGTRDITIDAAKVATSLSLIQGDLNHLLSPVLQLGVPAGVPAPLTATSGNIVVNTAATRPDGSTLSVETTGAVSETAAGTLTGTTAAGAINLYVDAGGPVNLPNANRIAGLFADVTNAGATFTLGSTTKVTVDNVAVVENFATGPDCAGTVLVDCGVTTNNGDITLSVEDLDIVAGCQVNAGSGCVTIQPFTAATNVTLGAEVAGTLSLTDAELDRITAGAGSATDGLRIGRNDAVFSGSVSIVSAIDQAGSNYARLALRAGAAGGSITETGGTVAVSELLLLAGGNVTMLGGNAAGVLAGSVGGAFRFVNAGTLTVGAVQVCTDAFNGVQSGSGDVLLVSNTANVQLNAPVVAGVAVAGGTTARLQARTSIGQAPAGIITAKAVGARASSDGVSAGNIQLDQANVVGSFGGEALVANDRINFRTTTGLVLDSISADGPFAQVNGVLTDAATGQVRLHAANGITQTTAGRVVGSQLGVRNDATNSISLLTAIDYVAGTGNRVGTFAGVNAAPAGRLDLATLGDLTVGTVATDGTFAQVHGIVTNNGGSNLRTGNDFTGIDHAAPLNDPTKAGVLINLGTGDFLLNPGQSPTLKPGATTNVITFNAEAIANTFRLGAPQGGEAPPPPPFNPAQNPPATTPPAPLPPARNNALPDTFNVRPSKNVQIIVNGNLPTTVPGDVLNLILTDLTPGTPITFTPGGPGAGRFDFGGVVRAPLLFTGIERIGGLSIIATSTQTGTNTFTIGAFGTIFGFQLTGGLTGGTPPSNPFVVSPALVNPAQPNGAPRLAVGDFNGDGVPDLVIGNGPGSAPLVSVVDGNRLFGTPHPLAATDLVSQFFAYDPNFVGGIFVATGNLNNAANGQVEIVTGPDVGGGPHVRVFRYNATPGLNVFNNVVDNAVNNPTPFPLGGFFAYDGAFSGGVRVAVGDVNGDGTPDIITGAGPGGGPHVKVFSGTTGGVIRSFFAYNPAFVNGGVFVAAGDYDQVANGVVPGRFTADIVTGPGGTGVSPHVRVFSGAGGLLTEFIAFGPDGGSSLFGTDLGNTTGVGSVAVADLNGDGREDILVTSARGPRARLAAFLGNGPVVQHLDFRTFPGFTPPVPFALDPSGFDLIALDPFGRALRDGSWVAGSF